MSKGVKIRIPDDRQDDEKARPDDGVYYLGHGEAETLIVNMVEQMAIDCIEGRGDEVYSDAVYGEAQGIINTVKSRLYRRHRP